MTKIREFFLIQRQSLYQGKSLATQISAKSGLVSTPYLYYMHVIISICYVVGNLKDHKPEF